MNTEFKLQDFKAEHEENRELLRKNKILRFDNAQLKEAAKLKVELVVEAQVTIEEANDKLDQANHIGDNMTNFKLHG